MSTPPNERSRRSQAPPPPVPQPLDTRSSSLSSAAPTHVVSDRRNERYIANADAGTSGGLMARLRQSQRQGRVQEYPGHMRSDPDNPFAVRQAPTRQAPPQGTRFRSPDMDSPPGVAAWPAPVIRPSARGVVWDRDRDFSSPTLGIMQRQQQQQQRGATSSSYGHHTLYSGSGAISDDFHEEAPSFTPMKRKLSLSLGQDGDSDEEKYEDDRGNLAGNSFLQRIISAGHLPQHDQQQQQQETPSIPADTTGLRNVFHGPSSTAWPTTPEGFSLFGGQPPRIPDLPGPRHRVLPEVRTFADTPTARLRGPASYSNNNNNNDDDDDDDDEPEPLWMSAGRRAVMRLKYGFCEEDLEEEAGEGGARTQAVRSGEQDVTSGSGSGSGSRTNISAQSDHSATGSSLWVGKHGFQIPSQDQQPRRDGHRRQQQQQQQQQVGEMSDQERLVYRGEETGSRLDPAGDHQPRQFSDDDHNAGLSDARESRIKQTLSRSSSVNPGGMRPPLLKSSGPGEEVAAEGSGSQEISPDARLLMALEAELEGAMLYHKQKNSAEHAVIDDESQFDHELDLSTDVLLRDLSHEHDQPLTSPDELELRSWMYEEGQIGRPQRVGHFASSL